MLLGAYCRWVYSILVHTVVLLSDLSHIFSALFCVLYTFLYFSLSVSILFLSFFCLSIALYLKKITCHCLQVGFWTIRVWAQGQIEEKQIKVEKYYRPKFEVFVRMPTFVFDTDQVSASSIYSFCWRIFLYE